MLAYLDGATGSYLLVAAASGVAGLWLFIKSGVKRFFRRSDRPAADRGED